MKIIADAGSPCHLVTLSPCHLVILSSCHLVILSSCHLVILSSSELARTPCRSGGLLGRRPGVSDAGVGVPLRADPGWAVARVQRPGNQGLPQFGSRLR